MWQILAKTYIDDDDDDDDDSGGDIVNIFLGRNQEQLQGEILLRVIKKLVFVFAYLYF